jgi:hypothetical protein
MRIRQPGSHDNLEEAEYGETSVEETSSHDNVKRKNLENQALKKQEVVSLFFWLQHKGRSSSTICWELLVTQTTYIFVPFYYSIGFS